MAFVPENAELAMYKGFGRLYNEKQMKGSGIDFKVPVYLPSFIRNASSKGGAPRPKPPGGSMKLERPENDIYEIVKEYIGRNGGKIIEMPFDELNSRINYPYEIQGFEDGNNLYVMSHDKEGKEVDSRKKARIALHEYVGSLFTKRGLSHAENEDEIKKISERLLKELSEY